jgi:hypothetical protein
MTNSFFITILLIIGTMLIFTIIMHKKFGEKYKWYHAAVSGFIVGFVISFIVNLILGEF